MREKHPTPLGNWVASACVYLNGQRPALLPAERAITVGRHRIAIACTAVCVCMRTCVREVFIIYDKDIWPRLIMIIIKIIILYFIQIRHTDDFTQRVYRLVYIILVTVS